MEKKREQYVIKYLSGVFFMICLFNIFGMSTDIKTWESVHNRTVEEVGDAVAYVNASVKDSVSGAGVTEDKKVALTFDDGPSHQCTEKLLDGLKEREVKATFFLIGENAEKNPELVKRIYEEGHLIGNHTYHHVEITKLSDDEAKKELHDTDEVIYSIIGEHIEYMRPPFGVWQKKLETSLEVLPVFWTVDPLDWTTENVDEIVNKVVTEVKEDDIILLHDCYNSSVAAALRIVDILTEQGFEFVTVDELLLN